VKAIAIIPARYDSTRFPAKALALLQGRPVIQWVWEAAADSGLFDDVIVATDSALIREAVEKAGGKAVLTRPDHPSGTDRVAEVAASLKARIIVNIQGDEPLIKKTALRELLGAFSDSEVQIASLMTPIRDTALLEERNTVKVVVDVNSNALYFSRAPIPFNRDKSQFYRYWRHVGAYAYRRKALLELVELLPGELEQVEKLEQLRALENGMPIRMVVTDYQGIGIDTPRDLERVETLLKESR
jgi:3-deoxy-manno-octulosonate cytidylyltransferase (CMP-KDO synthetase)